MYQLRLGISISYAHPRLAELLAEAKALGFDSIDYGLSEYRRDREKEIEAMKTFENGLKMIRDLGLTLNGVHVSFGRNWNFASTDEEARVRVVNQLKEIMPAVDSYHPHCYVLHGSNDGITDEERPAAIEALKRSLTDLVPCTQTPIALENLPRKCLFNTAKEGISIIDTIPGVKVCLDTNHFLQEKTEDAILVLGSRITTTHVSDHDYIDERHLLPGEASIDWMKVIGAFEKIGYNGIFNYEVSVKNYSLAQIQENHRMLFEQYNNQ